MISVAFQGTFGAYGHEAIKKYFFGQSVEPVGFDQSEQVIEALLEKNVDQAILPIENSIVGNVIVNSDLILSQNITIVGEFFLPIRHSLLGIRGSSLENIKEVYSHPIALAQCRQFLEKHNIKTCPSFDTAGSSAMLNKWDDPQKASISSEICADLYNLDVLSREIQQVENNYTRFVILKRAQSETIDQSEKISIAFKLKHSPGALLKCLKILADQQLNMTKLESRPIPENPFQYYFYVDFLGDIKDSHVQEGLKLLEEEAQTLKLLGAYKKADISAF